MAARDGSTMELSIEVGLSSSEDEGEPPAPPQRPWCDDASPPSPTKAAIIAFVSSMSAATLSGGQPDAPSQHTHNRSHLRGPAAIILSVSCGMHSRFVFPLALRRSETFLAAEARYQYARSPSARSTAGTRGC